MLFSVNRTIIVGCLVGWTVAIKAMKNQKYGAPKEETTGYDIAMGAIGWLLVGMALVG